MPSIGICRVFLVNRLASRMFSSKPTYEDAVHKLNLLQSNKSTIEQIRKDIRIGQKCTNLEDMKNYLQRTGVTLPMLDQLSVIHVAGTKGKGSTSAMCESILRTHGFRTGFYSSPHLVEVRERIRLDGITLTRSQFAEHFCQVYNALYNTQSFEGDMPKYFAFLTVLAFNVFLKEKVDVAIVEVGIGGIVDYTNILRKVPVVGITALGLDHTSILGHTLPEIAAAKAGIMKRGCEAYTVTQPTEAMDVLRTVASNTECSLNVVPDFDTYKFQNGCKLSIPLQAYQMNASLAIQLSHAWMRIAKQNTSYIIQKQVNGNCMTKYIESNVIENGEPVLVNTLTKETVLGLKECKWPGRYHIIKSDYAQFYLDGAHTKESMEICAQWFIENNRRQAKVLIFSATGDRDAEVLLKPLKDIDFETVFIVIPTAYKEVTKSSDNYSSMEHRELLSRCKNHAITWKNINKKSNIVVLQCVSDALLNVKNNSPNKSVLITGSLHLVGAALSIIDPNLSKG
ncbi:folylpolyglutamate synthase, mitochondrial isoform X1 [Maniola jurtina]|uniref:folylpolyglutamate synthase, mitochondrial isoform X1 n=3 Tax=Maniola jurtina TaxID=191418 RepID=UPI001E689A9B|nr:folylpolyglutamate synthase, mitochondrial isoform X1 [Maniola jurtina]